MSDTIIKFRKTISAKKTTKKIISAIEFLAPQEKGFWFVDGQYIQKLSDLASAIGYLNADQFKHHVSSSKNDFANWINDVFGLSNLARQVRQAKNKNAIIEVLNGEVA